MTDTLDAKLQEFGDLLPDAEWDELRFAILRATHGSAVKSGGEWQALKADRLTRGLTNISIANFGYRLVDDTDVQLWPDPYAVVGVREAFALYATGIHSTGTIADMMAAQGYKSGMGNPVSDELLREVFLNPVYLGMQRIGKRRGGQKTRRSERAVIAAAHPPVLSPDLWFLARQAGERLQQSRWALARVKTYAAICLRTARCNNCGTLLKFTGGGGKYPDGTYREYRLKNDDGCRLCSGPFGYGETPVLGTNLLGTLSDVIGETLTAWQEERLGAVREMWQEETEHIISLANQSPEPYVSIDFQIDEPSKAREVAMMSIWQPWENAGRRHRRNASHVSIKNVWINLDPTTSPSIVSIDWKEPFNKFYQETVIA